MHFVPEKLVGKIVQDDHAHGGWVLLLQLCKCAVQVAPPAHNFNQPAFVECQQRALQSSTW